MTMGQDHAYHLLLAVHDVGGIRDHDVDAMHLARGKHQARVDDEQLVVGLQHEHVLANFAKAAQGYNSQQRLGLLFYFLFIHSSFS